ncbi:hypothetical protein Tco_0342410, partial [Tanacetum coccineum]
MAGRVVDFTFLKPNHTREVTKHVDTRNEQLLAIRITVATGLSNRVETVATRYETEEEVSVVDHKDE